MTRRRITPEAGVLKACTDLLSAERIWWMRLNVGAVKIGTRFIKFNRSGTADILATPVLQLPARHFKADAMRIFTARLLWIECKSLSGRQSPEQRNFQNEVEANGHQYLIVRKPEDLIQWLTEHGAVTESQ